MVAARIDAVIFDLDGLLIDSERLYTVATNKVLEPYGHKVTWEFKSQVMGKPQADAVKFLIDHYNLTLEPSYVIAETQRHLEDLFTNVQVMPGAIKLLHHLKKHGIPIAMATGSQTRNLEIKMTHLPELIGCFPPHTIVTGDSPLLPPGRGKPFPDIFEIAARQIGIDTPEGRSKVLVFEDGVPGLKAGRGAGMHTVWVPDPDLKAFVTEEEASLASQTLESLEHFDPTHWGLPPYET